MQCVTKLQMNENILQSFDVNKHIARPLVGLFVLV